MKKILIIEDDIGISNSLKMYLESSEFDVKTHEDGNEAIKKIKKINPDLIVLDINLPGLDGIEICKQTRVFSETPIIMLTARDNELDRVHCLEIGADDYIAKPFSPRELLARINTNLRRNKKSDIKNIKENKNLIIFKNIEIDTRKSKILVDRNEISLTKNELEILIKLIKEDGNIVSRDAIMKDIIGYDEYVFDRTIDTHIKNIRRKIGDKNIILTVRGEGYRLNK